MEELRKPLRLFLFSHPRTASNLSLRLLGTHPVVGDGTIPYPYILGALLGPEPVLLWNGDGMGLLRSMCGPEFAKDTFQVIMDRSQESIAKAEAAGKIPLLKDHPCFFMKPSCYVKNIPNLPARIVRPPPVIVDKKLDLPEGYVDDGDIDLPIPNPTLIPDRMFKTFVPIFAIRHPALMVPSCYRASNSPATLTLPEWSIFYTYRWVKEVFDCYRAYYQAKGIEGIPIVFDGSATINDTEKIMEQACARIGFDPAEISYSWKPTPNLPLPPEGHPLRLVYEAFLGNIHSSTGVMKEKKRLTEPVIEEEYNKWKKEFGLKHANRIREIVEIAMADYNYLLQYAIKAE
ncbi:hypothetical protein FISHEDRAFT_54789 [Fistulina hepatica ATCC 64428]|uniref:Uncharacterized protein n=1 Tax=Fistulina hepatica ATCC 64428 TaxID=1128425 RepID=A0A0D7AT44_9AGAR|nr:hypothetical protein FISHEDRAFT_54789 [Fistulina hepatica ATCC 64428]